MSTSGSLVIQSGLLADLVVSNDPNQPGQVILRWLDGNDTNQQWLEEPATNGFYLRNVATGTYLAYTGDNARVTLDSHGSIWQKTGADDRLSAIRLTLRPDQNLNALGAHARVGTAIGTWGWSGGDGNETWLVSPVSSVWPRPTKLVSFVSGMAAYLQLAVDPANPTGALVVNDNFASQATSSFAFIATQWFGGFSIVNKASNLLAYVSSNGNGSKLLQRQPSQLDSDAIWTYGRSSTFQAIRPWINSNQNWNVFGNPHPIPKGPLSMGTWSWGGGQENELWQTIAAVLQPVATGDLRAEAASALVTPQPAPVAEVWARIVDASPNANGALAHGPH
ncbi:RICIN domain-containing protein [Nitrospirillum sp. BR 11828]|uniref:RICIN domain-containing protein n=1 Tax=Nitrospirillum sp. BR 11828 TaxID=3104325 RepID=UPI002ACA3E53|nr:RICIN domain-containing protein [Nitrospirillum sp. BR 11828]MDZ5646908.1 RICIN domain-containing protein [Nitrospirillum sp. BR 11828]